MRALHRNQAIVVGIVVVVLSCLALPQSLIATGSRITPSLLSPEKKEIFAVDIPPFATAEIHGGGLFSDIVLEALRIEHVDTVIETLPLTRLLRCYLLQGLSLAVLAEGWNFTDKERKNLIIVPFYVERGRYFYYQPANEQPLSWNEGSVALRSHTYGVQLKNRVHTGSQSSIEITYDRPAFLFKRLKNGSLNFVSAPDIAANWIIDKKFSKDKGKFGKMKIAGWQVPASIIFNKKHSDAEAIAKKFVQGFSMIVENGRYRQILEKYDGPERIPGDYMDRLADYWKREGMTVTWGKSK